MKPAGRKRAGQHWSPRCSQHSHHEDERITELQSCDVWLSQPSGDSKQGRNLTSWQSWEQTASTLDVDYNTFGLRPAFSRPRISFLDCVWARKQLSHFTISAQKVCKTNASVKTSPEKVYQMSTSVYLQFTLNIVACLSILEKCSRYGIYLQFTFNMLVPPLLIRIPLGVHVDVDVTALLWFFVFFFYFYLDITIAHLQTLAHLFGIVPKVFLLVLGHSATNRLKLDHCFSPLHIFHYFTFPNIL